MVRPINRTSKIVPAILIILILIFLLYLFIRSPSGVKVHISEATLGDLTSAITASGIVRPLTEVQISSSVSGTILHLAVKEGQQVKKGDLLLQIDSTEFRAQLRRSQAGLEVARANLEQSRSQWSRAQQLYKSELISEQEYESARTSYLLSQAQVKEAQANLQQSREQLEKTRITSPVAGTVIQIDVELGENVITGTLNTPGTRLMVVADLSGMKVESKVSEADIARVAMGQRAVVTVDALPQRQFGGRVNEISYSADENPEYENDVTVNYNISILIEGEVPDLKPGMSASSDIIVAELKNVLLVPIQSVITRPVDQLAPEYMNENRDPGEKGQIEAVFIAVNETAQLVAVVTGEAGEEFIQIKSGLKPGQWVITGPFNSLRDLKNGQRIKIER